MIDERFEELIANEADGTLSAAEASELQALCAADSAKAAMRAEDRKLGEALLAMDVRGHRPKQRGARLVGPVRTAKTLDRRVGPPARLDQVMDPALLVGR